MEKENIRAKLEDVLCSTIAVLIYYVNTLDDCMVAFLDCAAKSRTKQDLQYMEHDEQFLLVQSEMGYIEETLKPDFISHQEMLSQYQFPPVDKLILGSYIEVTKELIQKFHHLFTICERTRNEIKE